MEKEFEKLAKLMMWYSIIMVVSLYIPHFLNKLNVEEVKEEVVKLKEKYEKNVVAFGDGWEIRLDNSEDYYRNCDELKEAFIAIYGYLQAKDSIIKNQ